MPRLAPSSQPRTRAVCATTACASSPRARERAAASAHALVGLGVDGHDPQLPGTAAVLLRDELGADDDRYPQVGVGPDGAGEIRVAADRV